MCLVSSISPHPIFVSTGILWIGLKLFLMYYTSTDKGMDDGTTMDFSNALSMYKPAGSLLLKLLSPTIISFSLSIFSRRRVLYENLGAILAGSIVSGLGTLYGTAAFVRLISLGGPIDVSDDMALATPAAILRLSTLDRNVVAPLAKTSPRHWKVTHLSNWVLWSLPGYCVHPIHVHSSLMGSIRNCFHPYKIQSHEDFDFYFFSFIFYYCKLILS